MHHWVKYCVNQCMKSEVITITSFVTDGRTDGLLAFLCPHQWLRHGGGQKDKHLLTGSGAKLHIIFSANFNTYISQIIVIK